MKTFFAIVFFATMLALSSCRKENNPVIENDENAWSKVARIENVSYPKIHFLDESVGFISASVYYASMQLQSETLEQFSVNDTTFTIIGQTVLNTGSSPTKYPLWKTTNGGQSWNPIKGNFITSIKDISFVDEQTGFLVTDVEGVFKTLDGGDSWLRIFGSRIEVSVTKGSSGSVSFAYPKEVCFYDQDHGFIYTVGLAKNLFLFTNDGGLNWDFRYLDFRGENYIFPENGNNIGYATNAMEIAKTTDGGLTWNRVVPASISSTFSFVDASNGVYSNNQQLFKTVDGGLNFTTLHDFESDYRWGNYPTKILYKNSKECYFIIADKIGISVDGCKTIMDMSAPKTAYMDIAFPSQEIGYAINSEGEVFKYNSGLQ